MKILIRKSKIDGGSGLIINEKILNTLKNLEEVKFTCTSKYKKQPIPEFSFNFKDTYDNNESVYKNLTNKMEEIDKNEEEAEQKRKKDEEINNYKRMLGVEPNQNIDKFNFEHFKKFFKNNNPIGYKLDDDDLKKVYKSLFKGNEEFTIEELQNQKGNFQLKLGQLVVTGELDEDEDE